jgi:peptide methionine sulfoxide reductase MsrA
MSVIYTTSSDQFSCAVKSRNEFEKSSGLSVATIIEAAKHWTDAEEYHQHWNQKQQLSQ